MVRWHQENPAPAINTEAAADADFRVFENEKFKCGFFNGHVEPAIGIFPRLFLKYFTSIAEQAILKTLQQVQWMGNRGPGPDYPKGT